MIYRVIVLTMVMVFSFSFSVYAENIKRIKTGLKPFLDYQGRVVKGIYIGDKTGTKGEKVFFVEPPGGEDASFFLADTAKDGRLKIIFANKNCRASADRKTLDIGYLISRNRWIVPLNKKAITTVFIGKFNSFNESSEEVGYIKPDYDCGDRQMDTGKEVINRKAYNQAEFMAEVLLSQFGTSSYVEAHIDLRVKGDFKQISWNTYIANVPNGILFYTDDGGKRFFKSFVVRRAEGVKGFVNVSFLKFVRCGFYNIPAKAILNATWTIPEGELRVIIFQAKSYSGDAVYEEMITNYRIINAKDIEGKILKGF